MLVFIISLLIGVGQVLLTEQLIYAFNKKEYKKTLIFIGIKFAIYFIVIALVVLKYVWHIGMALSGFAVGVPITAIGLFVYKSIYKK